MQKYRGYRVTCPCCGMLVWSSRFYNRYPVRFYTQEGKKGGGLKLNPVTIDTDAIADFRPHFEQMFLDLAVIGLVRQSLTGELAAGFTRIFQVAPRSQELSYQPKATIER